MIKDSKYWIEKLNLQPHPEGGFFNEFYRSNEIIPHNDLPERYGNKRVFSTSIYFMLTNSSVSKFHRLKSDEIWHYHYGGTLKVIFITESGELVSNLFGSNPDNNETLQLLIPKNTWFAASAVTGEYTLLSCTVAPGFEFEDFELADSNNLISEFPQYEQVILSHI